MGSVIRRIFALDPIVALRDLQYLQSTMYMLAGFNVGSQFWPKECSVHNYERFDFIIVGGGAAGCVLANRLTEDKNNQVLLIEAGDYPDSFSTLPGFLYHGISSRMDWNYTSHNRYQCTKGKKRKVNRGKVLGGSSTLTFLTYLRGSPYDYDSWAEHLNDDSWKYENVLPYFKKSERLKDQDILNSSYGIFHGTEGPIGVTKLNDNNTKQLLGAFEEAGFNILPDINGNDTMGFAESMVTISDGLRQSAAIAYLTPVKDRPNLCVITKSHVKDIVFDSNNRAIGVNVVMPNGDTFTLFADKEVIISAGSVNSPQILQLSGIGPKDHLENFKIKVISDLPVGKNLQDHVSTVIICTMGEEKPSNTTFNPNEYPAKLAGGYAVRNKSQSHPAYHVLAFISNADVLLTFCTLLLQYDNHLCQQLFNKCKGKNVVIFMIYDSKPKSRGNVMVQSKNYADHPKITPNQYANKNDVENQLSFVKDFMKVLNTDFFKSVGAELVEIQRCKSFGVKTENYWNCHIHCMMVSMYDLAGTCAMGTVVNNNFLVHGTRNLRVVDASVMPTLPSGNIYIPTVMIAEKAADIIKKDNK